MVEIRILGQLEMMNGDRVCTPSPPKVRQVLALLALRANRVVHMDFLIEELWGAKPPRSAVTTVQTYIYHLRKIFARDGLNGPNQELLVTTAPGYIFHLDRGQLDADVFSSCSSQGLAALESGRAHQAAAILRRALDMWTGPVLANVQVGGLLLGHTVQLEERRINALELRIQADIQLGRDRQLIGELRSLVASYPLNEWFHAQLIGALSRCGRRSEALQAYQSLRTVLDEELGVDPSPDLQRLQHEVLSLGSPDSPSSSGTRTSVPRWRLSEVVRPNVA